MATTLTIASGKAELSQNKPTVGMATKTMLLALGLLAAQSVFAVAADTALDSIWLVLQDYATGAPGRILIFLSFMTAIWFGIIKPNYTMAIGALLSGLLMAKVNDIIEAYMGAGFSGF